VYYLIYDVNIWIYAKRLTLMKELIIIIRYC